MDINVNSLLFDCPVCFRHFADAEPTTLPCGHSLCMEDAKKVTSCPMCDKFVPKRPALNYILRDLAINDRNKAEKAKEVTPVSKDFYHTPMNPDLPPMAFDAMAVSSSSARPENAKKGASYSAAVRSGATPTIQAHSQLKPNEHIFSKVVKRTTIETLAIPEPASSSSSSNAEPLVQSPPISDGLNILSLRAFPSLNVFDAFSDTGEAPVATSVSSGWRDALLRVCYESRRPLVVVDAGKTQIIVIVVQSVCVSPAAYVDDVCRSTVRERLSKTQPPHVAAEVPLLALSYCHSNSIELVDSIVTNMSNALSLAVQEVDTLDAVEFALLLTYLKQQEEMLSSHYKTHFQTINFGLSRPSFVIPLPKLVGKVKIGVCALPSCGVQGCIVRCSKCKGPMYCSREHQKEHWKAHRGSCVPINTSTG